MDKVAGELMEKTVMCLIAFCSLFLSAGFSMAQESSSIGATDDCSEISVDFADNPNLTRQEKTEMMDRALMNSLNKYERCQNSRTNASSASGGEVGAAGDGEGLNSTASSEMSGTQAVMEQDVSTTSEKPESTEPTQRSREKDDKSGRVSGSGKVPDDIPAADNDSILEEQIRQAATNETDPAIKAKLWNEYRKYKGLPQINK